MNVHYLLFLFFQLYLRHWLNRVRNEGSRVSNRAGQKPDRTESFASALALLHAPCAQVAFNSSPPSRVRFKRRHRYRWLICKYLLIYFLKNSNNTSDDRARDGERHARVDVARKKSSNRREENERWDWSFSAWLHPHACDPLHPDPGSKGIASIVG